MTRELMIRCINSDIDILKGLLNRGVPTEDKIKKEIEIKTEIVETLKAEPCDEQSVYMQAYREGYDKGYSDGDFFARHEEPCEDAVSREDIKKIAKEMYLEVGNMDLDVHTISDCISYTASKCRQVLVDKLNNLPPVTPKPKTGKWIVYETVDFGEWKGTKKYACDKCGEKVGVFKSNYCPNCGLKMEGEEDG